VASIRVAGACGFREDGPVVATPDGTSEPLHLTRFLYRTAADP
jgi:hypothetical protein